SYLTHYLAGAVLSGIGVGLAFATLGAAGAHALPPQSYAVGTAVGSAARQLGAVLGVAGLVAVLGTPRTPAAALDAFHRGWWLADHRVPFPVGDDVVAGRGPGVEHRHGGIAGESRSRVQCRHGVAGRLPDARSAEVVRMVRDERPQVVVVLDRSGDHEQRAVLDVGSHTTGHARGEKDAGLLRERDRKSVV